MPVSQQRVRRINPDFSHHATNGCDPKGWDQYRREHHVRGRISGTTKPIEDGKVIFTGWKPALLVRVNTSNSKARRAFKSFCKNNKIEYKIPVASIPVVERWIDSKTGKEIPQENPAQAGVNSDKKWEWTTVFEVTGGRALENLTQQEFVLEWCFPLNIGAPRFNSVDYFRPRY